jgi:hypothetical protein
VRGADSGGTGGIFSLTYRKYFFSSAFFFSAFSSSARIIGRDSRVTERIFKGNGRSSYKAYSRVRRGTNTIKGFWRNSRADFSCARIERNLETDIKDSGAGISATFFLRGLAALFSSIILGAIF